MWENYVLDPTLPEAVLLDGALVVISINPEAAISLAYPDGDVDLLPALEVDKAVDRSAAHRAEQITYTLTVRRAGYGATDDVVLRDELSAALRVLEVVVADQADPTQPTWDCRVTDQDDDGYAELLEAADAATFVVVLSAAELLALTGADASTMSWTAVLLVVLGLAVAVVAAGRDRCRRAQRGRLTRDGEARPPWAGDLRTIAKKALYQCLHFLIFWDRVWKVPHDMPIIAVNTPNSGGNASLARTP